VTENENENLEITAEDAGCFEGTWLGAICPNCVSFKICSKYAWDRFTGKKQVEFIGAKVDEKAHKYKTPSPGKDKGFVIDK